MRTVAIALVLGLLTAGTASAAPRHGRPGKKHHSRSMRHAKAKSKHSGAKHAASDRDLMTPRWA
ncbi:MAG: hypothetical protein JWM53_4164 [bacterium]|nr:hypothetical protein [bacterium]